MGLFGAPRNEGRRTMTRLCQTDDLEDGSARGARAGDRELLIVRTGGQLRAWLNVCPHQGRNLDFAPGEFLLTPRGLLVCPHHGASFDPFSGRCTDGPCLGAGLTPVPVVERDGAAWLELPADER